MSLKITSGDVLLIERTIVTSSLGVYIISMKFEKATEMLSALGHPVRLRIVHLLSKTAEGMPVGELASLLGVPGSTLSHHLSALVRAGVVAQERLGTTLVCRMEGDRLELLATYLRELCPKSAAERH